jgi:hypothetical protein
MGRLSRVDGTKRYIILGIVTIFLIAAYFIFVKPSAQIQPVQPFPPKSLEAPVIKPPANREVLREQIRTLVVHVPEIIYSDFPQIQCPPPPVSVEDIIAKGGPRKTPNRFAVVMPFIAAQLDKLIKNLERWGTNDYNPGREHSTPTDLIFFFNRAKDTVVEQKLKDTVQRLSLGTYFKSILFMYANLNDQQDKYPIAASRMFYMLHNNPQIRRNYAYYYYMEPDSIPIRSGWLDFVRELTFNRPRPFWSMGSIYRGTVAQSPKDRVHINGNAVYTTAEDYHLFLCRLLENQFFVFDVDPFYYFFHHYEDQQAFWHNFVFADFIVNVARTEYTEEKMKKDNPYTYLVHGGTMLKSPKKP